MVFHEWGSDFDWKGLDECCDIIYDICTKYGRFGGQIKEKWGCLRFYVRFGLSLHDLVYPGYYFNHFPKWLWEIDLKYITPMLNFLLGKSWSKYQHFIYREAYKRALAKFPHLKDEIFEDADYPEYLEGLYEFKRSTL